MIRMLKGVNKRLYKVTYTNSSDSFYMAIDSLREKEVAEYISNNGDNAIFTLIGRVEVLTPENIYEDKDYVRCNVCGEYRLNRKI